MGEDGNYIRIVKRILYLDNQIPNLADIVAQDDIGPPNVVKANRLH